MSQISSIRSGIERVLIALSGEILGFVPAAILVGTFCILTMGLAGVVACFFVAVASLGALPGTLIPASVGIATHFRGHVLLGAAVPILALMMLYVAAASGGEHPDLRRLAIAAAVVMAFLSFLLEVLMSRVFRWRPRASLTVDPSVATLPQDKIQP